jgi:hypothetical protein
VLFTGSKRSAGRVVVNAAGAVDHVVAGFAYTATDELVTDAVNAPQNWIKGVGIRNTGAVCTTTSTSGTDVYLEGVRCSTAGKLVVESAAPAGTASGNPVTATGALAITP